MECESNRTGKMLIKYCTRFSTRKTLEFSGPEVSAVLCPGASVRATFPKSHLPPVLLTDLGAGDTQMLLTKYLKKTTNVCFELNRQRSKTH